MVVASAIVLKCVLRRTICVALQSSRADCVAELWVLEADMGVELDNDDGFDAHTGSWLATVEKGGAAALRDQARLKRVNIQQDNVAFAAATLWRGLTCSWHRPQTNCVAATGAACPTQPAQPQACPASGSGAHDPQSLRQIAMQPLALAQHAADQPCRQPRGVLQPAGNSGVTASSAASALTSIGDIDWRSQVLCLCACTSSYGLLRPPYSSSWHALVA